MQLSTFYGHKHFINGSHKNNHQEMLNGARPWLMGPFIAESGLYKNKYILWDKTENEGQA